MNHTVCVTLGDYSPETILLFSDIEDRSKINRSLILVNNLGISGLLRNVLGKHLKRGVIEKNKFIFVFVSSLCTVKQTTLKLISNQFMYINSLKNVVVYISFLCFGNLVAKTAKRQVCFTVYFPRTL